MEEDDLIDEEDQDIGVDNVDDLADKQFMTDFREQLPKICGKLEG